MSSFIASPETEGWEGNGCTPGLMKPSYLAALMLCLWLFIGIVAAYDVYLSVKYHETLRDMELNPLGNRLIELDCGRVAFFMGCKCFGSLAVLGTLQFLYFRRPSWAILTGLCLAAIQAGVALYLTFG